MSSTCQASQLFSTDVVAFKSIKSRSRYLYWNQRVGGIENLLMIRFEDSANLHGSLFCNTGNNLKQSPLLSSIHLRSGIYWILNTRPVSSFKTISLLYLQFMLFIHK